jgi:hypothetical protein
MEDYGHWVALSERPAGAHGFIYAIFGPTGRQYIGRKQLISVSTKLPPGKSRRVKSYKESDWRGYTSSCRELLDDISLYSKEAFTFVIYDWCMGRGILTYRECQEQWDNEVLSRVTNEDGDERLWYNGNIGAVKFLKPA